MNKLKENYDEIAKERQTIIEELKELEKDEKIKRFLELKKQNENLYIE